MKESNGLWFPDKDNHLFNSYATEEGKNKCLRILRKALDKVTNFKMAIDGGAFVGLFSLEMAKKFNVVFAFEPCHPTRQALRENTDSTNNIFIYDRALGDKFARASQNQDDRWVGNMGGRYLIPGDDFEVVPLDCFELNDVGLIKLDIEGYEYRALQGAQDTIKRCKPVIIVEDKPRIYERQGVVKGQVDDFLKSLGTKQILKIGSDIIYGFR